MDSSLPLDAVAAGEPRGILAGVRSLPPRALLALAVLVLFLLAATIGPVLHPYGGVLTSVRDRLLPPLAHTSTGGIALLGTDQLGRDLLAEVLAGSRVSLIVAASTIVLGGIAGLVLGMLAGYFGGWLDTVISRLGDIQLAFPSIMLAILLAGVLGPSLLNVVITLAVTRWVVFARVVRASAISVRHREFVDSARVLGASHLRILVRYILPSCLGPLFVVATVQVGLMTVAEASLSFLGLGVPVAQASWGSTIANGRDYIATAWWIATMPGLALAVVVVAIGILGDVFRDATDPTTDL